MRGNAPHAHLRGDASGNAPDHLDSMPTGYLLDGGVVLALVDPRRHIGGELRRREAGVPQCHLHVAQRACRVLCGLRVVIV